MGRINETVRTVNSAVRTALVAAALAGAAVVGWKGYSLYNEPQQRLDDKQREVDTLSEQLEGVRRDLTAQSRELESLGAEIEKKNAAIARLETSVRLLKLRRRIARLRVVEQRESEDERESGRVKTIVEFYEVNDDGAPVDDRRRQFEIEGDRVYVECLVAKFEDRYVEQNDLDRNTAICLFQRIFGEYQEPQDGYELDPVGTSPTSYARGGEPSEFEQRIWNDFWNIANDPAMAEELGIRAAHADAPSIRVREGVEYELELRTTGEFTLRPLSNAAPDA